METISSLINPEFTIETKSKGALDLANRFKIDSDQTRLAAGEFLKIVKTLQAEVKKDREAERVAAKAVVDAVTAGRKRHLEPLEKAETVIKVKVLAYNEEQDRLRREEQQRLIDEAQREAEEAALQQAEELEAQGEHEAAAAVLDTPMDITPVIVEDTKPKVEGQHTTVAWKCRLVDIDVLVDAVAEGYESTELLAFNQVACNARVAKIKEHLSRAQSAGRLVKDVAKIEEINKLPNGTVLTEEMIGDGIDGVEIYLEKSLASTAWK